MIYSQPQFQPISPQMNISNFEHFGASNVRFFLPFEILHYSVSDLQPSSEEVIPSVNAKNTLMNAKEEEAIIVPAKALNGEDVFTLKKKERPSKGAKNKYSRLGEDITKYNKECNKRIGKFGLFKFGRRRIHSEVVSLRGQNVDSDKRRDGKKKL